jgi:hypothetical protein
MPDVRLAGAGGPVTGIVDWGGPRPGRPALIDEYLMALTAGLTWWAADVAPVVRTVAAGLACGSGKDYAAAVRR